MVSCIGRTDRFNLLIMNDDEIKRGEHYHVAYFIQRVEDIDIDSKKK